MPPPSHHNHLIQPPRREWLNFQRLRLRVEQPIPLPGGTSLHLRGRGGGVVGDLPPYEAFPLGGTNSVRGYAEGGVGSGRYCVEGSAELRWTILKPVHGSLFIDGGSDLDSGESVIGDPAGSRGKPGRCAVWEPGGAGAAHAQPVDACTGRLCVCVWLLHAAACHCLAATAPWSPPTPCTAATATARVCASIPPSARCAWSMHGTTSASAASTWAWDMTEPGMGQPGRRAGMRRLQLGTALGIACWLQGCELAVAVLGQLSVYHTHGVKRPTLHNVRARPCVHGGFWAMNARTPSRCWRQVAGSSAQPQWHSMPAQPLPTMLQPASQPCCCTPAWDHPQPGLRDTRRLHSPLPLLMPQQRCGHRRHAAGRCRCERIDAVIAQHMAARYVRHARPRCIHQFALCSGGVCVCVEVGFAAKPYAWKVEGAATWHLSTMVVCEASISMHGMC